MNRLAYSLILLCILVPNSAYSAKDFSLGTIRVTNSNATGPKSIFDKMTTDLVGGFFNVVHNINGIEPYGELEGSGMFLGSPLDTRGFLEDYLNQYPDHPLDECQLLPTMSVSSNMTNLEAGKLSLEGPQAGFDFKMIVMGPMKLYTAENIDGRMFLGDSLYSFNASGSSQIASFHENITSPISFTIEEPNHQQGQDLLVDRQEDLQVTWESNSNNGPLFVFVSQKNYRGKKTYSCKFTDDGIAQIPASVLQMFDASDSSVDEKKEEDEASITFFRYSPKMMNISGAPGPIFFDFRTQLFIDVEFR